MRTLQYDKNIRYQTMDNFGASACWWLDPAYERATPEDMARIAELLFDREKGAGLSCIRFNLGGGSTVYDKPDNFISNWMMRSGCFKMTEDGDYDWSEHAGQQYLLREAKRMGVERAIAFVNSPPAWMTKNGHCRSDEDDTSTTNMTPGREGDFAKFLVDVLAHFQEEGLPFDYISPINEPAVPWNSSKQEGCRYSNEDMVPVILALADALQKSDVTAKILVAENNTLVHMIDEDLAEPLYEEYWRKGRIVNDRDTDKPGYQFGGKYNEVIRDFLSREDIRAAIAPIAAGHSYGTDIPGRLKKTRDALMATMGRHPGLDYWMTELCVLGEYGPKRDLTMAAGEYVAKAIHGDLVYANAAAWQWWLALSGGDYKDALVYLDMTETDYTPGVYDTKILWTMGHYARFLRPGAQRVEMMGGDLEEGLLASGWLSAEGKAVAVILNTSDEDQTVKLEGMPEGSYELWRTDDEVSMANKGDVCLCGEIVIPAHTFTTIAAK